MKIILAAILSASANAFACEDANDILKRFFEVKKRNSERTSQYTFVEQKDDYVFDNNGQPRKDRSQTHEVIFVEGESYRKLVARGPWTLPPVHLQ